MFEDAQAYFKSQIDTIRQIGLFKDERIIITPLGVRMICPITKICSIIV